LRDVTIATTMRLRLETMNKVCARRRSSTCLKSARKHSLIYVSAATLVLAFVLCVSAVYASDAVGVPLFHFRDGTTHCAGKAFAVKWFNNKNILICPLHLLGPAGGYPTYVDARSVSDVIDSVDVLDLQKGQVLATAKRGLLRKGSPVEKASGNLCDDLIAFDLANAGSLTLFGLSAQLPAVGTKVWVLTKSANSRDTQADRYSGSVSGAAINGINVKLDEPLDAPASSGSPVVDAKSELVGMLVGTGDEARTIINAAPAAGIYRRLYTEISK
jgi:hypothetical protein